MHIACSCFRTSESLASARPPSFSPTFSPLRRLHFQRASPAHMADSASERWREELSEGSRVWVLKAPRMRARARVCPSVHPRACLSVSASSRGHPAGPPSSDSPPRAAPNAACVSPSRSVVCVIEVHMSAHTLAAHSSIHLHAHVVAVARRLCGEYVAAGVVRFAASPIEGKHQVVVRGLCRQEVSPGCEGPVHGRGRPVLQDRAAVLSGVAA